MRRERITQKQAQGVYDAIKSRITLCSGKVELPSIDMAEVFNERKSMTWYAVVEAVKQRIDAIVPSS